MRNQSSEFSLLWVWARLWAYGAECRHGVLTDRQLEWALTYPIAATMTLLVMLYFVHLRDGTGLCGFSPQRDSSG